MQQSVIFFGALNRTRIITSRYSLPLAIEMKDFADSPWPSRPAEYTPGRHDPACSPGWKRDRPQSAGRARLQATLTTVPDPTPADPAISSYHRHPG